MTSPIPCPWLCLYALEDLAPCPRAPGATPSDTLPRAKSYNPRSQRGPPSWQCLPVTGSVSEGTPLTTGRGPSRKSPNRCLSPSIGRCLSPSIGRGGSNPSHRGPRNPPSCVQTRDMALYKKRGASNAARVTTTAQDTAPNQRIGGARVHVHGDGSHPLILEEWLSAPPRTRSTNNPPPCEGRPAGSQEPPSALRTVPAPGAAVGQGLALHPWGWPWGPAREQPDNGGPPSAVP